MNLINYLLTSFLLLCEVLSDNTVTEFATELVYVCPSDAKTSTSYVPAPPPSKHVFASLSPEQQRIVYTAMDIENDFQTGSLMLAFQYDMNLLNNSNSVNVTSSLPSSSTACNYTAPVGYWNASTTVAELDKRYEPIEDINVMDGNKEKGYLNAMKEFEGMYKKSFDNLALVESLKNDTFMGAVSVYVDIADNLSDRKSQPSLDRFRAIIPKVWECYYDNDNEKSAEDQHKTEVAIHLMRIITPNYYTVQSDEYESSQNYINGEFNRDNAEEKNVGIVWILKNYHVDNDEMDFIKKLVNDRDTYLKYIKEMLNYYYGYGISRNCAEGDSSCRIIGGWGAARDTDSSMADKVAGTALALSSLFGVGIPVSEIISIPFAGPIPVHPSEITSRVSSYSTVQETAASTSFATDICVPTDEYADFDNEDGFYDHLSRRDDEEPGTRYRFVSVNEAISQDDFCEYAPENTKTECKDLVERHCVGIQRKEGASDISYDSRYEDFVGKNLKIYTKDENGDAKTISEPLPIYIVNPLGESPGVACNAMKFLARTYDIDEYFQAYRSPKDFLAGVNPYLVLTYAFGFDRNKVYSSDRAICPIAASDANWEANGQPFELDEFPPNSANYLLQDPGHAALTAVPRFENRFDGTCLGAREAGWNTAFWYDDKWKPWADGNRGCMGKHGIARTLDLSGTLPRIVKTAQDFKQLDFEKEFALEKRIFATRDDYDKFMTGQNGEIHKSAFALLINTKDAFGHEIKCERYKYGTDPGRPRPPPQESQGSD